MQHIKASIIHRIKIIRISSLTCKDVDSELEYAINEFFDSIKDIKNLYIDKIDYIGSHQANIKYHYTEYLSDDLNDSKYEVIRKYEMEQFIGKPETFTDSINKFLNTLSDKNNVKIESFDVHKDFDYGDHSYGIMIYSYDDIILKGE